MSLSDKAGQKEFSSPRSGTVLDLWFGLFLAISLQKEMYRSKCRTFLGCHEQSQWKAPSQCGNLGHEWSQFFHPACDITFCVFFINHNKKNLNYNKKQRDILWFIIQDICHCVIAKKAPFFLSASHCYKTLKLQSINSNLRWELK